MHEPPAATADMAVLPGVLGSSGLEGRGFAASRIDVPTFLDVRSPTWKETVRPLTLRAARLPSSSRRRDGVRASGRAQNCGHPVTKTPKSDSFSQHPAGTEKPVIQTKYPE